MKAEVSSPLMAGVGTLLLILIGVVCDTRRAALRPDEGPGGFVPPAADEHDFVFMECVLSIFPDKESATCRLVATAGCVGGALSLAEYASLAELEGLAIEHTEDCRQEAASFLDNIRVKMVAAEIAGKLGKLPIGDGAMANAERLIASVEEQLSNGRNAGGEQAVTRRSKDAPVL